MAKYKLTSDTFLNNIYYTAGTTIDWEGPPNKAMVALDEDGKPIKAEPAPKQTYEAKAPEPKPVVYSANEIPQEGGDPPDPTWAPEPRPAFAVKTMRTPDSQRGPGRPKSTDKESSVVRTPTQQKT